MTRTAVWCFKVKDVKSRNRFSRTEKMMSISQNYQNLFLKRGTWSAVEDQMLKAYIKRYGIWNWNEMPKAAGLLRSGKSCRLRWMNYLRPDIKHGNFSKEELKTIIELHEILGNRWSAIAAKLPGRTDNEIKNLWNTYLRNRFNNNISNTAVQRPKLQGKHAYEEESQKIKSSEIDVSLPTAPKILNSEEYSSKWTLPMSPILSTDNFSSSSSNPVNDSNETHRMEENVGSLESFGESSLWDQPFSTEAQICKEYGETYTDEMWVQELLYYPNASHNFECKQRNSSDIDVSPPTGPKILNSDEYSSKWTLPMSPILSTDNLSSSSSNPVNDSNENQRMEETVGSLESFGEPSLWDQPFSTEDQMCKVEDYGETYSDEMWVQELLYYPNASHNFECKQRNSSDIDVSLTTSPKILNSEEYSSKGTLNMSPFLSTDHFSSSCSSPVNDINGNQHMEENVGSLESFGELSFWDQPFSMEAQTYMCKVGDYGETYTDKMWVQELLYY